MAARRRAAVLTTTFHDLEQVAAAHGVHIAWHRGGPKGAWLPRQRKISLRHGMDDTTTLCTLAHEVAHVVYDHPADTTKRQEVRADMWAAHRLIDPTQALRAARMYPHHSAMIAHELGVTVHLLRVWCSMLSAEMSHQAANLPDGQLAHS